MQPAAPSRERARAAAALFLPPWVGAGDGEGEIDGGQHGWSAASSDDGGAAATRAQRWRRSGACRRAVNARLLCRLLIRVCPTHVVPLTFIHPLASQSTVYHSTHRPPPSPPMPPRCPHSRWWPAAAAASPSQHHHHHDNHHLRRRCPPPLPAAPAASSRTSRDAARATCGGS